MTCLSVLTYLLVSSILSEAARILAVFPTPSISHQVVFRPLTQELAKRGHQVTIITPDPAFSKGQTPENLTEIDVHDLSYGLWKGFVDTATGDGDIYLQMKTALKLLVTIFAKQIEHSEVQAIINDESKTFDLLLLEGCVRPALAMSHVYKVPVIQVSSFGQVFDNYKNIGGPQHPLLYPTLTHQYLYNLTLLTKIKEVYSHFKMEYLNWSHEREENEIIRRIFPDAPTLSELSNNIDMLFLNVHPIWEGNYPVPPAVVYIGGLHQKPRKELPQDLKRYLDSSKHGVIYMSFGTNTNPSSFPPAKIQMFVKVFSKLPYDVLWKWDKDEIPGRTENIRIGKWFPQSDLLRHPKIKLFITQGGLQSTDEAITAGVPLIGIPILGDQWYNVEKYVFHKIGVRLDMESLTEESFRDAIKTVISDKSYRSNIIRLRTLMRDQPQQSLERAVWWTEYVLRHSGARHLRAPAANISWTEYFMIDVIASVLLVLLVTILVICKIVLLILRAIFGESVKVKKN